MSEQEHNNVDRPFHREGDAVIFDAPPDPKETARQRREDEQHEFARSQVRTNRKIAGFTLLLVVATFCTIAVGVWQGSISQKAANAARDSADAAVTAANAAKESTELTRKSIAQAREQFSQDQRPYLWLTSQFDSPQWIPRVTADPESSGQVIWNWHYTNYGRTPAYDVTYKDFVQFESGPKLLSYGLKDHAVGAPVAPTQVYTNTVVSDVITHAQWLHILATSGAVQIYAVITYSDSFRVKHETGLCLTRTNAGSISTCLNGNYIK